MKKATPMANTVQFKRTWHLLDAEGKTLGRLSTQIANLLLGKSKVEYTPNADLGDYVVVINASKVKLTGNKLLDKTYSRHSGFPGGFRQESAGNLLSRFPSKVFEHAVSGMLPKNKLHSPRMRRLKVYPGKDHPHGEI